MADRQIVNNSIFNIVDNLASKSNFDEVNSVALVTSALYEVLFLILPEVPENDDESTFTVIIIFICPWLISYLYNSTYQRVRNWNIRQYRAYYIGNFLKKTSKETKMKKLGIVAQVMVSERVYWLLQQGAGQLTSASFTYSHVIFRKISYQKYSDYVPNIYVGTVHLPSKMNDSGHCLTAWFITPALPPPALWTAPYCFFWFTFVLNQVRNEICGTINCQQSTSYLAQTKHM